MSRLPIIALVMAAVAGLSSARAQSPPDSATLPPPIRSAMDDNRAMCREQGEEVQFGAAYLQPGDLDGDGRTDYLINQDAVTCPNAASLYCGNSPCPVYALLAVDGFMEARHVPDYVFEPKLLPQGDISVVETQGVDDAGRETRVRWMWRDGAWRSAVIRRD